MRVRAFLPFGVDALASVLDGGSRLAELAVGRNRQDGNTAAGIVRNEDVLAVLVEDEVAGTGAH
jgi:hypothetical protein